MSDAVARGTLCPHCNRYNSRHIVVNCIAVFQNKIFLIKRGIEPEIGEWALPGGYLDWDESLEEGAIRELLEETGLTGEVRDFLGYYDSPWRTSQNLSMIFIVDVKDEKQTLQKEEILDGKWFESSEVPEKMAFDHSKIIADFLNQSK